MTAQAGLLGAVVGVVMLLFLVAAPVGLYIWLRARGVLGDPAGRGLQ